MIRPPRSFPARAAILYALLALACFPDVLFSTTTLLSQPGLDLTSFLLKAREYGFGELARGHLPLWNPYMFSGTPFAANVQTALYYPPNWIYLVCPAVVATNWSIAFHLALAAWLTAIWSHSRTGCTIPSLLAGLAYAAGGALFSHLHPGHLTILCAAAWPPLLLHCVDQFLSTAPRQARLRQLALAAIAIAMPTLAGHPQVGYYAALTAGLYLLFHLPLSPKKLEPLILLAIAALLGVALSAIQMLPSMALSSVSVRQSGLSRDAALSYALPPESLLTTILPHLFGSAGRNDYLGRWFAWETSLFVGAVVLTLALFSLTTGTRPRRIAAILVILLFLAGISAPVQTIFWRFLPGYALFRAAARFGLFIDLLFAILAADGLAALARSAPPRRLIALTALAACTMAACIAVVHAPGLWLRVVTALHDTGQCFLARDVQLSPSVVAYSRATATTQLRNATLFFALLTVALALWRRFPHRRTCFVAAVAILSAVELLLAARIDRSSGPPTLPYPPTWAAALPSDPDARVLTTDPAYANEGLVWHYLEAWGYDPMVLARYARFLSVTQRLDPATVDAAPNINTSSPLFRLLRIHRVFYQSPQGPRAANSPDPLPRFHWLHHDELHTPSDLPAALSSPTFDPARTALLEQAPSAAPEDNAPDGQVHVADDAPEQIDFDATTPAPAILLITDSYAPGWTVTSLSQNNPQPRYDLLPADLTLRAIPLAAGTHHLRLQYHAPGFTTGACLSLVAAFMTIALLVSSLALPRRP